MEEKKQEEQIKICPLLSIGKDTPVLCRQNCQWYYKKDKDCVACLMLDELYGIKVSLRNM